MIIPLGYQNLVDLAKRKRTQDVAAIKVTTQAGNTFDGDEISQERMARTIVALGNTGATINWVLADNSIVDVGVAELQEALLLAGSEQARLWVLPYTGGE